jgi:hypothetical protein
MRLVCARSKRPDSPASHEDIAVGSFDGWPRSRLVFIRPASPEDIAKNDARPRWYQEVYDAALLKLPDEERHAFAQRLSSGRFPDSILSRLGWAKAVRTAITETKCPFHEDYMDGYFVDSTDWWRLPNHRFFSSK